MGNAVRVGDLSNHGGTIVGPGVSSVLIAGMPACVAGDAHVCSLPPSGHQPTTSPFPSGSTSVLIGGLPALRSTDACLCGAVAVLGAATVEVG